MNEIVKARLTEERKNWRKDHPIGFWARPSRKPDGSTDLMRWEAGIPGKAGTPWEKGVFTLEIVFNSNFPASPPDCNFKPTIFHPNVYPSGRVCLSILDESKTWKPSITVKQILLGIQDLLDSPNNDDPAQQGASQLLRTDPVAYEKKVREQALRFSPSAGPQVIE